MSYSIMMEDVELLQERLALASNRIEEIKGEHINQYASYFERVSTHIIRCINLYYNRRSLEAIEATDVDELAAENKELFLDITDYEKSYLNPAYAVSQLGDKLGRQYNFLYNELMAMIPWAIDGRLDLITIYAELFLEVYGVFCEEFYQAQSATEQEEGQGSATDATIIDPDAEHDINHRTNECIYWFYHDYCEVFTYDSVARTVDDSENLLLEIVGNANLEVTNYLYAYGVNISDNERGMSEYLAGLEQSEIDRIASTYVNGFIKGFEVTRKDISKKSTVKVEYPIGFERVVRSAIKMFADNGLKAILSRDGAFSFEGGPRGRGAYVTCPEQQWVYDHKNDKGFYFDKRFYNRRLEVLEEAFKYYEDKAKKFAGPAVIEAFGEKEFNPINKPEAYKFTDKQNEWNTEYLSKAGVINNKYIPSDEYSFTIIAFPIPEIGTLEEFHDIFRDTMALNTLDYDRYLTMQQKLIDILDQGERVHIMGHSSEGKVNETDLTVSLYPLKDAASETIFENCVADVNIPVGEVFTSPVLKGTNGVLNVSRVFLNGLAYENLRIEIKDGMITDYNCTNFDKDEDNRNMIFENVLYRHKTLPMGEFAIGTNTTAYKMARDYAIEDKMPILIAEKTGPHFAFGDTCYSHAEDVKMYNPNGKEVVARENECSVKRHEDISAAYFNCHTDVTIPYDELAIIEVICSDGTTIPIIKDGRFVVPGCEELNKPLDEMNK